MSNGDALTVTTTGAQAGTYGTVTIAANGAYSFTLNNGKPAVQALGVGQTLTQSFNYTISDGNGGTVDLDPDHHHHRHQRRPGGQCRTRRRSPKTRSPPVTGNVLTNDTDVEPATP